MLKLSYVKFCFLVIQTNFDQEQKKVIQTNLNQKKGFLAYLDARLLLYQNMTHSHFYIASRNVFSNLNNSVSKPIPKLCSFGRANSLFLLLMDENLAEVLKGISLGEDKSIIIPEDDDFCAIERGGRSILGRLLNPECQIMGRMLKTMPKIWKVYERVRGLALTKERFQFVFDLVLTLRPIFKWF